MLNISAEDKSWVDSVYNRIIEKESRVMRRTDDIIPYTTENGRFTDKFLQPSPNSKGMYWWTNGFWPGMVWLMYMETGDDFYKELANRLENRLDEALYGLEGLHHDVGFMWLLSGVANYRITGNEKSKIRGLTCANFLASRFNIKAGFISAWNGDRERWAIIDCMMNIPLLYWASDITGYSRYRNIAVAHADKTLENFIRHDGSCVHIVEFDLDNGSVIQTFGGQGYEVGSSWTRGQSWAIYGFVLSYIHTKDPKYLNAAKKVANYYIAAIADHDYIPPVDFRSPAEPRLVDTTSGVCAACGLIEISRYAGEFEKSMYLNAAIKILRAIEGKYADWTDNCDALIHCGTGAYHSIESRHTDIIYGDYYFMEAIIKLKGNETLLW